ncbi:MAG: biotin carboxylase N-terminal domain-containing protein [Oceanicoccus sp.]
MNVSNHESNENFRFNKVLVANRGEIAVRVIKACRDLHISSVAIYSTADSRSRHVQLADEAVWVGAAEASDSYLNIDRIIDSAKSLGVDAIHPGYGFLAENAQMADACARNGIVFIGPSTDSMKAVASKQAARELVASLSLPTIPGLNQLVTYGEEFVTQCEEIGFPVLLKASAGGGGVGMRIVEHAADLEAAFAAVSRESQQAFGDSGIIVEKYLPNARHIEVQVLADHHGHCVHLHERDCSIQRRRQKIVEESPARLLSADIKQALCDTAVAIARHIDYHGAGTVEFLYSSEHQQFYFLEMNTRLQVEHGVTELVTGIDIVQWQIRLAEGEVLSLNQADIPQRGHAIECRVCAENPARDFIPAIGTIEYWAEPQYQRCDSGIKSGDHISIYYDSLVAKVIAHGDDFSQANRNLQTALNQSALLGVDNNLSYLRNLISSDSWRKGGLDTQAVDLNHAHWTSPLNVSDRNHLLCAALAVVDGSAESCEWPGRQYNPQLWQVSVDGVNLSVESKTGLNAKRVITIEDQNFQSTVFGTGSVDCQFGKLVDIEVNQHRFRAVCVIRDGEAFVHSDTIGELNFTLGSVGQSAAEGLSSDVVSSPMPAKIIAVNVAAGDQVVKGQVLLILESMKMETSVAASRDAVIASVNVSEGELVEAYASLVEFTEEK